MSEHDEDAVDELELLYETFEEEEGERRPWRPVEDTRPL